MYTVHVGEFSAPNYPSLEGGFKVNVDDVDKLAEELKGEYPVVDKPRKIRTGEFAGDYEIKVYELSDIEL